MKKNGKSDTLALFRKDETTNIPAETILPSYFLDALFVNENVFKKFASWKPIFLDDESRRLFEYHLKHELFEEIDLDVDEFRALQALFTMYSKRNNPLQGFVSKWSEFYRACCAAEKNKDFALKEKMSLRSALASIERKEPTIVYRRFSYVDKKTGEKQYHTVTRKEPLCKVMDLNLLLSKDQIEELPPEIKEIYLKSRETGEKLNLIFFKLNPVIAEILNYFRIIDTDFYKKVRDLRKKRNERVSKFDFLFYYWLSKQTSPIVEIDRFKLAEIIKMSPYTIINWRGYVEKFIEKLYGDFKKLGYLLKYELNLIAKTGGRKDRLYLNPEKFPHLKKKALQ